MVGLFCPRKHMLWPISIQRKRKKNWVVRTEKSDMTSLKHGGPVIWTAKPGYVQYHSRQVFLFLSGDLHTRCFFGAHVVLGQSRLPYTADYDVFLLFFTHQYRAPNVIMTYVLDSYGQKKKMSPIRKSRT